MNASGGDTLFVIPGLNLPVTSAVTTTWAIIALSALVAWLGTRRLADVPGRLQAALELTVDSLLGFFTGLMGRDRARLFLPLLASLFLFILVCNYVGFIPGAGHLRGLEAPTANWGTTAGLAAIVFVVSLGYGLWIKRGAYFRHFIEPHFLAPLMIPLGVIEEFSRPFSLSLRLVANVFAGETLVVATLSIVPYVLPVGPMLLEAFFGAIQAFIFAFLTAIYINMAVEE